MMLRAVIFDMDGVLVDSEPLHFEVESRVFTRLGIEVPLEERHSFVGKANDKMWAHIKEKYSLDAPVEDLLKFDTSCRIEYLSGMPGVPVIPGVPELLRDLRDRGLKLALASSSPVEVVDIMMNRTGLGVFFDRVICGGSVKNGKPAPDIFLMAARSLGTAPGDCVVIEDSRNGVIAAKSAGMKCVGYKNPNSGNQDLSGSDMVVEDMRKIDYNLLVSLSGGEYSGPVG